MNKNEIFLLVEQCIVQIMHENELKLQNQTFDWQD
jgi:hypothetical protein